MTPRLRWKAEVFLESEGSGPIDAFVQALSAAVSRNVRVLNYSEHAIGEGANAEGHCLCRIAR